MEWPTFRLQDDLSEAIEAIAPVLAATEEEAEAERHLPAAAVDAIRGAGLFRVALPAEVGGMEADPVVEMEVYERVARINTAAGWNLFVGNFHTSIPAAYAGDEAIEAMFGDGRESIVAGQPVPICRAKLEPGGMRVSGRHSWGSGISHAQWVLAGCRVEDEDATPVQRVVVVPKESVQVIDNWEVFGLSGTGSCDYVLEDVFVPDGFWWEAEEPVQQRGGSRYSVPVGSQAAACHIGLALGVGERALELIVAAAEKKKRLYSTQSLADRGAFQRDLGRSYTELSAAREYGAARLGELGEIERAGNGMVPGFHERLLAAATFATDAAMTAAQLAYRYAGGSGPRLESPFQRVIKDLLVAQQHIIVADQNYDKLGRRLLSEQAEAVGEPEKVAEGAGRSGG